MPPPRLAVIGCGAISTNHLLPALVRINWRPSVLVDPLTKRASKLARRHRVRHVAGDVSELANGEIEAALIATPPAQHAPISMPLLERGIHVFVEKPMATSADDARAMIRLAEAAAACLAVGHVRRFIYAHRWIKAVLEAGALGDIERFDVQEGHNLSQLPYSHPQDKAKAAAFSGDYAPSNWVRNSSNSLLLQFGSHVLDTLLWWFGGVQPVSYRDDALGGIASDARLELVLENGAIGTVELSRVRTLRNTAIIVGSRGRIEVSLSRSELRQVTPDNLIRFEFDGRDAVTMKSESLFELELEDWLRTIRNGGESLVSGSRVLPVVALIDDCHRMRQPWQPSWARTTRPKATSVLKDKTVLVTGASGFIGARLVEKLVVAEGARVKAGVHTFRNVARLARLPAEMVELRQFDMGTPETVDALVEGCDTVFHLAHDFTSAKTNEKGARLIGAACRRLGARLVYAGSASVYRLPQDRWLTEASPVGDNLRNYKYLAEREVRRMIREEGLQATIIQPTIVYGPFGRTFTDRPVEMLLQGTIVLPEPGNGICNAVYVDDVVRAFILAAQRDEAIGETILVSGSDYPTWCDLYGTYSRALGREDAVRLLAHDEIVARRRGSLSWLNPKGLVEYGPLLPVFAALYNRLGPSGRDLAKRLYNGSLLSSRRTNLQYREFLPSKEKLAAYASRHRVQSDKARRLLGWEPAFDFRSGMDLTADYIGWAYGHRTGACRDCSENACRCQCLQQQEGTPQE